MMEFESVSAKEFLRSMNRKNWNDWSNELKVLFFALKFII